MTVIEFFDKESAVENIVSTLLCKPEKVVFLGNNSKRMKRSIEKYKAVAQSRGVFSEFEIRTVPSNNLMAIVGAIEEIIKENPDCVVDLTGGDDLFLVAVGIVYGENADTLKLHRFNISDNKMVDCDSDGELYTSAPMEMTVEENVAVYGGRVIYENEKSGGTLVWNFGDGFADDVYSMWSVCKQNPAGWNKQIKLLDKLCREGHTCDGMTYEIHISDNSSEIRELEGFLKKLSSAGVINKLCIENSDISFTFKNEQIKKCLTKSGLILELIIALSASEAEDEGVPVYNDVLTGVFIDWDGELQPDSKAEVENEMDVVLMKGMVPVFISCKNGTFSVEELYKLSVVARRFGGSYVRKVLVATELEKLGSKEAYIRARAENMGIKIIDDADSISEDALKKKIKNLWRN